MMNTLAAVLMLAIAIAVAGYFIGGRYDVAPVSQNGHVIVIDRLTGNMWGCAEGGDCYPYRYPHANSN